MEDRRSQRERDASAQSAHVAERASAAIDGACASTRMIRTRARSEGVVVEASVIARLLRWRLLTIDASVLLLPASAPRANRQTVRPPPDAWSPTATKRERLSDAIKNIDQADHDLARARDRRNGCSYTAFG